MDVLRSLEGLSLLNPDDSSKIQQFHLNSVNKNSTSTLHDDRLNNIFPEFTRARTTNLHKIPLEMTKQISNTIMPSLSQPTSVDTFNDNNNTNNNDNTNEQDPYYEFTRTTSYCPIQETDTRSLPLFDEHELTFNKSYVMVDLEPTISENKSNDYYTPKFNSKDFIIMDTLGTGGSYVVQKAFHIPSCKIVAIKSSRNDSNIDIIKQIETDIKILKKFENNKNIVNIILYGKSIEENIMKVALEYMDGGSLKNFIKSQSLKYNICNEKTVKYISKSILLGLNVLHKSNLIHNDIKPANILYNSNGNIKLNDFGIVQKMKSKYDLKTKEIGSDKYNSPEKSCNFDIKYNTKTDIWSFGLTIYEICNLKFIKETNPVKLSENPPKLSNKLFSNECCDFIDKCLLVDYKKRWSVDELLKHPFLKDVKLVNLMNLDSRKKKGDLNFIIKELIKYYSSRHFINIDMHMDRTTSYNNSMEYSDKIRIENIALHTGYSIKEVEKEIRRQVISFIENIKKTPTTVRSLN